MVVLSRTSPEDIASALEDLYKLLVNIGYIDQDDIDWSGTLLGTQQEPTYYGPKPKPGVKIEILPESYTVDYSDPQDVMTSRHSYKFPKDKRRKLTKLPPYEVALTGGTGEATCHIILDTRYGTSPSSYIQVWQN
jgi:hypothetical protein